jgi:hypothetical protein
LFNPSLPDHARDRRLSSGVEIVPYNPVAARRQLKRRALAIGRNFGTPKRHYFPFALNQRELATDAVRPFSVIHFCLFVLVEREF